MALTITSETKRTAAMRSLVDVIQSDPEPLVY